MMHFRKKSNVSGDSAEKKRNSKIEVSKEDAARLKVRTASVADPILDAVHEAQPFEQAADTFHDNMNRQSYFSQEDGHVLRDVFGQPITNPDISNPTRARDERPLDTIRAFEYAVSGDPVWAQQLETPQYGFRVRPDFPSFNGMNPYDNNGNLVGQSMPMAEQGVYQAPVHLPDEGKKKKKRNFFGRKKKK
ncbi:Gsr1p KNAG_0E01510 [Huiozyma naganishii CBS 8797]|uniref:Uncharacterized protein n=1 Tax=Huiozyma naganishii (strain ATCC MYA-139 / BCRC 22969 / CBS 8797 / KCTC 17520 / NBRC 10181 / NCYC 3082 / Yp74L-3) TaxID=1071383 RepID=J7R6D5_HUIN7|nr:hypothetical protein KNAG_0E01510 [Kazachstania naganishii CBS 8797]CCK70415.1 hypothetical protein KNAG_0E01510 [Kazachstania naganishii CBS 8797]